MTFTQRQLLTASILSFVFGLALVTTVFSGSITVVTTPEQDAALAELAKQPVSVAGVKTPSTLTPAQIVQGYVDRSLAGPVARVKRQAACAKVTDASAKQALGCPK